MDGEILLTLLPVELFLTDVLTPANLQPLFANPALLASVFPHLPPDLPLDGPPTEETIQRVIDSPQFHASVQSLDQALATGLLGGFVRGLGLPEEAGLEMLTLPSVQSQSSSCGWERTNDIIYHHYITNH